MSTPIIEDMSESRKRSNPSNDNSYSLILPKRPKIYDFYKLASESSVFEDERSESVDSIQGKETDRLLWPNFTDFCNDTSDTDTDTKSESEHRSDDEYDMKVEDEPVSSLETEENPFASGENDALLVTGDVAATIANNGGGVDIWLTDGEDETDGVSSTIESIKPIHQLCKKCKKRRTFNYFPLCLLCYRMRKNCYPPRPRHKNANTSRSSNSTEGGALTKTARLFACLNVSSQDFDIGSSQEIPSNVSSSQELVSSQKVCTDETIED